MISKIKIIEWGNHSGILLSHQGTEESFRNPLISSGGGRVIQQSSYLVRGRESHSGILLSHLVWFHGYLKRVLFLVQFVGKPIPSFGTITTSHRVRAQSQSLPDPDLAPGVYVTKLQLCCCSE